MRLPRQVLRSEVVPPEAGELAVPPREAGSDGRMVCCLAYAQTAESSAAARPTART